MVGVSGSSEWGAGSTRSVDSAGGGGAGSPGSVGGLGATGSVSTGSSSAGGSTSNVGAGGSAMTCVTPEACGGSVEGTWKVRDSCLTVSGEADVGLLGLGCSWTPIEGSLTVGGTFSVTSVGAVDDRTTTVGTIQITLPPECLQVGVVTDCARVGRVFTKLGYEAATCREEAGGCRCLGTVRQTGSMGVFSSAPAQEGRAELTPRGFSVYSSNLTAAEYSSCTRGNSLLVTPLGGDLRGDITGAITLDRL